MKRALMVLAAVMGLAFFAGCSEEKAPEAPAAASSAAAAASTAAAAVSAAVPAAK